MSEGPLIGVPVFNLEILGKCLHVISPPLEEALSLFIPKETFYFSVCSVNNFSWSVSSALVSLTVSYFQYRFTFTKSKGGVGSHIGVCLNNSCTCSFLLLAGSFWLHFADRPLQLPVCFSVKNSCRFMGPFYYVLLCSIHPKLYSILLSWKPADLCLVSQLKQFLLRVFSHTIWPSSDTVSAFT